MVRAMIKLECEILKCELEIEQAKKEVEENQKAINRLIKESEEFARPSFEIRWTCSSLSS